MIRRRRQPLRARERATAAREAASHAGDDEVLLRLAEGRERRAAAPPAPALGLVFAGVEYDE